MSSTNGGGEPAAAATNGVHHQPRSEDNPMYDPFRRHDKYGRGGLAPQPWSEWARLALLLVTFFPVKLLGFAVTCCSCLALTNMAWLVPARVRLRVVAALGRLHCSLALLFLGFPRVKWVRAPSRDGKPFDPASEPAYAAVVANHVSPCDVLVMMSRYFPSFVAKASVATTPLVAAISKYMDCVFVDIKSRVESGKGLGMSAALRERMLKVAAGERPLKMCVFPEGTTTSGEFLIPFRTGAFLAGVPVKPHVLQYSSYHVSPAWESIDVVWLLFLVLANPWHSVTVTEYPVYVPSPEEKEDPALYARNVRQFMLDNSTLKPSSSTYKDELDYNTMIFGEHKAPPPAAQLKQKKQP